jgi:hypothetical protein
MWEDRRGASRVETRQGKQIDRGKEEKEVKKRHKVKNQGDPIRKAFRTNRH